MFEILLPVELAGAVDPVPMELLPAVLANQEDNTKSTPDYQQATSYMAD
jgi:hypothetical protein